MSEELELNSTQVDHEYTGSEIQVLAKGNPQTDGIGRSVESVSGSTKRQAAIV